jgi:hypothetical protein
METQRLQRLAASKPVIRVERIGLGLRWAVRLSESVGGLCCGRLSRCQTEGERGCDDIIAGHFCLLFLGRVDSTRCAYASGRRGFFQEGLSLNALLLEVIAVTASERRITRSSRQCKQDRLPKLGVNDTVYLVNEIRYKCEERS